jgi:spore maturation protein SpmA
VNHIVAALIGIGILFGIWAGIDSAADGGQVRADLAAAGAAIGELSEGADMAAVQSALEQLGAPLEHLNAARLPRELSGRVTSLATLRESAVTASADTATGPQPPAVAEALSDLRRAWQATDGRADVSDVALAVASVSRQGADIFTAISERAKFCVIELAFPLIGIMAFWLGVMRVAEEAGIVQALARAINPFFRALFPKVPKDHPANGAILMSLAANIIGLDNAATPLSLKAMKELQTLNTGRDSLTNSQGMLLVLNATSINVIPFSIIAWRLTFNSQIPNDIILPTLLATTASTVVGVTVWLFVQRMSADPAAVGEEAARITAEINAELHGEMK